MIEYETTMVMRPELAGDQVEAMLDRVREVLKGQGGKLLALSHWGKKRLAYDIAKQGRGIYVLAHYLGQGPAVAELERNLRINDSIMRFMTIRLATDVSPQSRQEVAYVRPEYESFEQQAADEPSEFSGDNDYRDRDRGDRDRGDRDRDRDRGDRPFRRGPDAPQERAAEGAGLAAPAPSGGPDKVSAAKTASSEEML